MLMTSDQTYEDHVVSSLWHPLPQRELEQDLLWSPYGHFERPEIEIRVQSMSLFFHKNILGSIQIEV
jgi:hypothetical protein